MQGDEPEQQDRQQTHVCAVEPANEVGALGKVRTHGCADRPRELGPCDRVSQRLRALLIPAQHGAGECHGEQHDRKGDPSPPGHFARSDVAAAPKHPAEVKEHGHQHNAGAPVVETADPVAQRHLRHDVHDAVVRSDGIRVVVLVQHNPGCDEQQDAGKREPAQHVGEPVRLGRDRVVEPFEREALSRHTGARIGRRSAGRARADRRLGDGQGRSG